MKKILITGAYSYIGTSFEKWVNNYPKNYFIDTVDMREDSWKGTDFSEFDTVLHVAGLAHADIGNVSDEMKGYYYKINRDLAIETAEKAKRDGVKQFVFMSSIIVYGDSNKQRIITRKTAPTPGNFYGDSKLQAEEGIRLLSDEKFKVVILRPPMVYGKGSKGNYSILVKLAQKLPMFPAVNNQRSMLHIDNLCEFIRLIVENEEKGVFFPQNAEYVKTSEMVRMIAELHGKKIKLFRFMNWAVKLLRFMPGKIGGLVNKSFGNLVYEKSLSDYKDNYSIRNFEESIRDTEV